MGVVIDQEMIDDLADEMFLRTEGHSNYTYDGYEMYRDCDTLIVSFPQHKFLENQKYTLSSKHAKQSFTEFMLNLLEGGVTNGDVEFNCKCRMVIDSESMYLQDFCEEE